MKLTELEPQFLTCIDGGLRMGKVDTLPEAQGIRFYCPGCGNHMILVWFADKGVPPEALPAPRWRAAGTGYEDLSISPSINLDVPGAAGCRWHGFVTGGEAK
jgi:hypothetical protein